MAFAVGLSFVVLAWVTNAIVFWYVKGAVRQSLNEGIHAGLAVGPAGDATGACSERIDEALRGLLADSMRGGVNASCTSTPTEIRTQASVRLVGWGGFLFGGALRYEDTLTRTAPRELNPDNRSGV